MARIAAAPRAAALVVGVVVLGAVVAAAAGRDGAPAAPPRAVQGSIAPPATATPTTAALLAQGSPPPAGAPPATATATPPPCAGPLCHQLPYRLVIPQINVDAAVEQLGVTASGDAAVPRQWQDAGWFDRGYYPGTPGNAVILGHLDTDSSAHPQAVFWDLHLLHDGSRIEVIRGDGSMLTFVVRSVATYPADSFPLGTVFGPADRPILRLLTCAGHYRGSTQGYDSRTVVTAGAE